MPSPNTTKAIHAMSNPKRYTNACNCLAIPSTVPNACSMDWISPSQSHVMNWKMASTVRVSWRASIWSVRVIAGMNIMMWWIVPINKRVVISQHALINLWIMATHIYVINCDDEDELIQLVLSPSRARAKSFDNRAFFGYMGNLGTPLYLPSFLTRWVLLKICNTVRKAWVVDQMKKEHIHQGQLITTTMQRGWCKLKQKSVVYCHLIL